jgi:multiple sugar transport system ATP-binding protein
VFVAGFIGSPAMNLIDVELHQDGAHLGDRIMPLPREVLSRLQGEGCTRATLGFRPEAVRLCGENDGIPFDVVVVEELGSDAYAYGTLHTGSGSAGDKLVTIRVDARRVPRKGETIFVDIPSEEAHVFSTETGRRVSGARVTAGA